MTLIDLAKYIGLSPKWVAHTSGGEYHSPCPVCGGIDRFYIQPYKQMRRCTGYFCCRRCNIAGDAIEFAYKFLKNDSREVVKTLTNSSSQPLSSVLNYGQSIPSTLISPSSLWLKKAHELVEESHREILLESDCLKYLESRGLPLTAVKKYKIGWSASDQFLDRHEWGLSHQPGIIDANFKKIWIPRGVVIPIYDGDKIVRLKVRRIYPADKYAKYIMLSGSMNGLSIIGDRKKQIVIVIESELDAFALHNVAHDFACIVAVGSALKNPDIVTDRLATNAKKLLICHDNDDAGKAMLSKWQKLYSRAVGFPCPVGKDVGEAFQKDFNFGMWIKKAKEF